MTTKVPLSHCRGHHSMVCFTEWCIVLVKLFWR